MHLTPSQAAANLRALAQDTYARLFAWLVGRVNAALAPPRSAGATAALASASSIGVLDFFGYENVLYNGVGQVRDIRGLGWRCGRC